MKTITKIIVMGVVLLLLTPNISSSAPNPCHTTPIPDACTQANIEYAARNMAYLTDIHFGEYITRNGKVKLQVDYLYDGEVLVVVRVKNRTVAAIDTHGGNTYRNFSTENGWSRQWEKNLQNEVEWHQRNSR